MKVYVDLVKGEDFFGHLCYKGKTKNVTYPWNDSHIYVQCCIEDIWKELAGKKYSGTEAPAKIRIYIETSKNGKYLLTIDGVFKVNKSRNRDILVYPGAHDALWYLFGEKKTGFNARIEERR